MAIQNRRGAYEDFDPDKLKAGERATVMSGDPHAEDGRAVYECFEPGVVKRMATYEDMVESVDQATDSISKEYLKNITEASERAETGAAAANAATERANAAADEVLEKLENGDFVGPTGPRGETGPQGPPGAVENLSDQAVAFTEAEVARPLASGESLAVSFGKLAKFMSAANAGLAGLREDLDNLLDEDTIKLAQETGFLSGGGLTLLNSLLRLLLTNPVTAERDTGDWHVRERADGWTELTGTLGVDFPATVHSPSTGFHVRRATVPLPVALDTNRNRVAMAVDSSPGLHALNVRIHSSGDELKLTTGQPAENKGELPGYLTSIYVAGYKKA